MEEQEKTKVHFFKDIIWRHLAMAGILLHQNQGKNWVDIKKKDKILKDGKEIYEMPVQKQKKFWEVKHQVKELKKEPKIPVKR